MAEGLPDLAGCEPKRNLRGIKRFRDHHGFFKLLGQRQVWIGGQPGAGAVFFPFVDHQAISWKQAGIAGFDCLRQFVDGAIAGVACSVLGPQAVQHETQPFAGGALLKITRAAGGAVIRGPGKRQDKVIEFCRIVVRYGEFGGRAGCAAGIQVEEPVKHHGSDKNQEERSQRSSSQGNSSVFFQG